MNALDETPKPGSDEAIRRGCTCPRMDNARGGGIPSKYGTLHWVDPTCPLHKLGETKVSA